MELGGARKCSVRGRDVSMANLQVDIMTGTNTFKQPDRAVKNTSVTYNIAGYLCNFVGYYSQVKREWIYRSREKSLCPTAVYFCSVHFF